MVEMMGRDLPNLEESIEYRKADPYRALATQSLHIEAGDPTGRAHFLRHSTWDQLGEYHRALEDCSIAIQRKSHYIRYLARADLYRKLGDYPRALDDLNAADALDHGRWLTAFGPHTRADTLARLGRLDEALADCAFIRDDHWNAGA